MTQDQANMISELYWLGVRQAHGRAMKTSQKREGILLRKLVDGDAEIYRFLRAEISECDSERIETEIATYFQVTAREISH